MVTSRAHIDLGTKPLPSKIFYWCYDHQKPTGGQKDTYRHVDALNDLGFDAYVVHSSEGFRLQWFDNQTRVIDIRECARMFDDSRDFLVVPEDLGARILTVPGRKIIFNKGIYHGFCSLGSTAQCQYPYLHPDVIAALVVSQHNAEHLRFAYPQLAIYLVRPEIDLATFKFRSLREKKSLIAFVPKGHVSVVTLFHLLRSRAQAGLNRLSQFDWVALSNKSEREVAALLGDALFLIFLSVEEGLPRTPLEGMASGCLVAAYDGGPMRETVPPGFRFPVGAVADMARYIEAVTEAFPARMDEWQALAVEGLELARSFSTERHKAVLAAVWEQICSGQRG